MTSPKLNQLENENYWFPSSIHLLFYGAKILCLAYHIQMSMVLSKWIISPLYKQVVIPLNR